jgi:hypothetical protein
VIQRAISHRPHRRRQLDFTTRQETLARKINLNTLYNITSYKEFFMNFKKTLAQLNFITWDNSEEE